MRISLTIYNEHLPQVQTALESCDLIFIPESFGKEKKDRTIDKFGSKVICLKYNSSSEIILNYLRGNSAEVIDRYWLSGHSSVELETIKASLPKNIELELYSKDCFYSDITNPKPITITINDY